MSPGSHQFGLWDFSLLLCKTRIRAPSSRVFGGIIRGHVRTSVQPGDTPALTRVLLTLGRWKEHPTCTEKKAKHCGG